MTPDDFIHLWSSLADFRSEFPRSHVPPSLNLPNPAESCAFHQTSSSQTSSQTSSDQLRPTHHPWPRPTAIFAICYPTPTSGSLPRGSRRIVPVWTMRDLSWENPTQRPDCWARVGYVSLLALLALLRADQLGHRGRHSIL